MANLQTCTVDAFEGYFMQFAVLIPGIMLVQLLLFCYTIYQECTRQHDANLLRRVLYILMQLVAMYWMSIDFARFVLAPKKTSVAASLLSSNLPCSIAAISPKVVPNIFHGLYNYQILLRLKDSFDTTPMKLRRSTVVFASMLIITYTIVNPFVFLFALDRQPCMHEWKPPDDSETLLFCGLPLDGSTSARYVIIFGVAFIETLNAALAVATFSKSYQLLKENEFNNEESKNTEVMSNMIKICLLTATGALTSTLAYAVWILDLDIPVDAVFLYVDLVVNCVVIGLMFKRNDKDYQLICKCCISCMFASLQRHAANKRVRKQTRSRGIGRSLIHRMPSHERVKSDEDIRSDDEMAYEEISQSTKVENQHDLKKTSSVQSFMQSPTISIYVTSPHYKKKKKMKEDRDDERDAEKITSSMTTVGSSTAFGTCTAMTEITMEKPALGALMDVPYQSDSHEIKEVLAQFIFEQLAEQEEDEEEEKRGDVQLQHAQNKHVQQKQRNNEPHSDSEIAKDALTEHIFRLLSEPPPQPHQLQHPSDHEVHIKLGRPRSKSHGDIFSLLSANETRGQSVYEGLQLPATPELFDMRLRRMTSHQSMYDSEHDGMEEVETVTTPTDGLVMKTTSPTSTGGNTQQ